MRMSDSALRSFDLNLLVVLRAIRDTGSVTDAAATLGLTQSGCSRALARLRDSLGDPLFVVQGHRLVPTPRCDALAEPLSACLDAAERVWSGEAFDPQTASGTVRLAMPDHLAFLYVPALLARLRDEAPRLDLAISGFSASWRQQLIDGAVDLAFGVTRGDETGLRMRSVGDDAWAVLVRKGHPVLRKKWTAAAFAAGDHGLMGVPGTGPAHVDRALAELGLTRRVVYRATSPLVVALAVVDTDLRVTTSSRLARALARRFSLRVLPLPVDAPALRLPLVWSERVHDDPRHEFVRGLVGDVVYADR